MRRWLSAIIFFIVLSLFGWWVQSSPAFRVSEIAVTGLETLSRSEVLRQLGGVEDKHFIEIWLRDPQKVLKQHQRIKEATAEFQFPSRLVISVEERKAIALIPYHNSFLSVDAEGKILQLLTSPNQNTGLPLLTGLRLPLLSVGDMLPVTPNFLAGVRVLTQVGTQYRQQLSEINVSSAMQVMLRSTDNILIDVGEGIGLSPKVTYLLEILSYVRLNDLKGGIILVGDGYISYCAPPTAP